MQKTNEELLKQFKKANKSYKQKLALKAGMPIEDYLKFLAKIQAGTKKTSTKPLGGTTSSIPKAKQTVHIVNIVDASGSMSQYNKIGVANDAVQADVKLVLAGGDVNYTYTLVSFSSNYDIRMHKFLSSPEEIGNVTRFSTRDMTALYQAIGETLQKVAKAVPETDKVIVSIITDGGENDSSGIYGNKNYLANFISKLEDRGFTVTFIGTDQDTRAIIQNLKLHDSNTAVYDGTGVGLAETFTLRSESLQSYSKGVAAGADVSRGFYKNIV